MADDALKITVSYSGREKHIPLVVRPSIELSDLEVDQAELELCGIVRHVFNVPAEASFSLHEAETSRTLTKESFRDPGYIQAFPRHWYLTVEKTACETGEEGEEEAQGDKVYEPTSAFDLYAEGYPDLDDTLPSLAELSLADAKYQTVCLTAADDGLFGVTLRFFSIQPVSAPPRADSPCDPPLFGAGSQNSQQSSDSLDILSTTFVHRVEGVGLEAGLQQGDTVHMINGASIIRSSFSEIEDLLAQCGSEITLMVLPKEHDDLQFLYPQYTGGSVGEYTSGDEKVIARDIPIAVGKATGLPQDEESQGEEGREEKESLVLYQFNGSASSLDHTHSNSSNEHLHQAGDDRLISCSIYDIPVPSPSRNVSGWSSGNRSGTGSNSQLDRLDENAPYVAQSWKEEEPVANGDVRYEFQAGRQPVDPSWYQDPPDLEEDPSPPSSSLPRQDPVPHKEPLGRAHSQDSAMLHRVSLHSTGEEEGSHSQPMWAEDLGVVRIKKGNSKKSLEMLTSLSTTPQPRGMRRIRSDDVIGQKARRQHVYETVELEFEPKHNSQEQDTSITPTIEEPPADSYKPPADTPSPAPAGSGVRARRAVRSYSIQRQQLHKSRSRAGDSEAAARRAESLCKNLSQPAGLVMEREGEEGEEGEGEGESYRPERFHSESGTAHPIPPAQGVSGESVREEEGEEEEEEGGSQDQHVTTPTIRIASEDEPRGGWEGGGRRGSHTLGRGSSPPMAPRSHQSATLDPRTHHHTPSVLGDRRHFTTSVEVPLPERGSLSLGGRIPLVKTRSAQTPYGTEVVRELNIDDAVAASQGGSTLHSIQHGTGRSFSIDEGSRITDGDVGERGQAVGMFPPAPSLRRHSMSFEERSATNRNVPCHGQLMKKQVSEGQGKRSSTRWRQFYTVLVGSHMVFYKDKKDADANKPCDEPPLEVVPGRADLTHGYTKRKCVFRVVCSQGGEYLMQSEDSQAMLHWVTAVHRLNGARMVEQSAPKPDARLLLSPGSPLSSRRGSSPQPSASQRSSRKKGLVSGLKNALHRKKGATLQPSFGQLLADCPMSTENKCVPLVVEFCVWKVEEQGLDVEGLYRKPGQASIIRNMVAEIDKGQFEFEEFGDIHTLGSLLKKFFQDLQDALIPGDRYREFLAVVREGQGEVEQVTRLRGLVFHLPMAHYHTLRFLTVHLNKVVEHAEQNKMVLRNVAMVFGPTLMLRSSPTEELDLVAMNNTFTVVELLCKHWRNIFDSETCYEEQQIERERERQRQREAIREAESGGGLGRTTSDPAVNNVKVKKDHALINASPTMVRRIKNQFASRKASDRNSYSGGEASSNSRKHHNHNRSDTLPPAFPSPPSSSFLSPPKSWGRAGSSGTLQARHHDRGRDLNPQSRYAGPRDHWTGGEEGRRGHTGSIWKDPQRGRGSGKDHGDKKEHSGQSRSQILSSHPPPPPIAHTRELLTSSQQFPHPHTLLPSHRHSHSSPSHDLLHRAATLPPSPEHHGSLHHHPGRASTTPDSPSTRRKISYNLAVDEGYRRQPLVYSGAYHRQQPRTDLRTHAEDLREKDLSRSYGPQSSWSANHSKTDKYENHSSRSRGHQSYGPQRGEPVQRSLQNHESFI